MKLYLVATFLMAVQVNTSPRPEPQGWNSAPSGWSAPPAGWSAPPLGWQSPPSGWVPPPEGVVVAAGSVLIADDILLVDDVFDNVTITASDIVNYDDITVTIDQYVNPDSDLDMLLGDVEATDGTNSANASSTPTISTNPVGYGYVNLTLTGDYVSVTSNPQSTAAAYVDSAVMSSFAQLSNGTNVAPGSSGSGWKKEN
ncbi:unnamed protein product [Orchesella dallaii]|uniref:Uncharacterized protein n=1 Tax=Orchesella dallaii TaxID=48710 RepID=A0ABP1Q4H1_9HEXA